MTPWHQPQQRWRYCEFAVQQVEVAGDGRALARRGAAQRRSFEVARPATAIATRTRGSVGVSREPDDIARVPIECGMQPRGQT